MVRLERTVVPEEETALRCRTSNLQLFMHAMQALSWGRDLRAKFQFVGEGLRVVVSEGPSAMIARAHFLKPLFDVYVMRSPRPVFVEVPLAPLLECLGMFSGSTSAALEICVPNSLESLNLTLEENGAIVDCVLRAVEFSSAPDIADNFDADDVGSVTLQADALRESLGEFDLNSTAALITVQITAATQSFSLISTGTEMAQRIDFPAAGSAGGTGVVSEFRAPANYMMTYLPKYLKPAFARLVGVRSVTVRMCENGLLCVTRTLYDDGPSTNPLVVEFIISPCVAEVDDDVADGAAGTQGAATAS